MEDLDCDEVGRDDDPRVPPDPVDVCRDVVCGGGGWCEAEEADPEAAEDDEAATVARDGIGLAGGAAEVLGEVASEAVAGGSGLGVAAAAAAAAAAAEDPLEPPTPTPPPPGNQLAIVLDLLVAAG